MNIIKTHFQNLYFAQFSNFLSEKVTLVPSFVRDLGVDFRWCRKFKRSSGFVPIFGPSVGLSNVHHSVHSDYLGQLETLALRFHLLEYSYVGLVSC